MTVTEPLVDIVMLISQQATWADLAIRAVEHHTRHPYRLILVDQATTDPKLQAVLKSAHERGHTVIRMAENRSFSNGNNAGIRMGNAKFICILNDDTVVCEDWDAAMVQDASEKGVGLVGARTNYAAGPTADPSWRGEPPYMAFVCVMLRREVWDRVGPLDEENFTGFSCEDLDYCWRVRKHGFKLKVCERAYVLHAGSRSIVKHVSGGTKDVDLARSLYNSHNEKYNRVLLDKWGKDWIEANTKLKQRILVATYSPQETVNLSFAAACLTLKQHDGYGFSFYNHRRTPIHLARQLVCDYALKQRFDVLVQLDDDATFPPDLLPRLVHHEKEVVCALAYQRRPPYAHVVYDLDEEKLKQGKVSGTHVEGNLEHTGLRKFDVSGFHVSAIRLSAIAKMKEAGITEYWGGFEKCGEDFAFAANLKKVGIPLYVDTDTVVGHIAEAPVIDEGYRRDFLAGKAR